MPISSTSPGTKTLHVPHTFAFAAAPVVTTADTNVGNFMRVLAPAGQTVLLHTAYGVGYNASLSAATGFTWKLRRYTSGAWGDISGFGTTASPLASSATPVNPPDVTLVDGDLLAYWIVAAGTAVVSAEIGLDLAYIF